MINDSDIEKKRMDKTLLTLTALRYGLKILWKPAAFWIAKGRVGQALMKRLLMLCV